MEKDMNNASDEKLVTEFRLLVLRSDVLKAETIELGKANNKLRQAFVELLEMYQGELDRRNDSFHDRESIDYEWLDRAGILD